MATKKAASKKAETTHARDTSERVHQRDKLRHKLNLRPLKWTKKQKAFIDLSLEKETKIVFVDGPAGTGKSLIATYCALELLSEKKVSDIVYIRSAVESSDSKLGFLPGDANQKLHFYNLPFLDKLDELLEPASLKRIQKEERISMYPVNYSRGMSWNAKCVIFDEVQNSSFKEIMTVLTRLGKFSKCFVLADPMQTDLQSNKIGGFSSLYKVFQDQESLDNGVHTCKFEEEDIMRSDLVRFLVKKFRKAKEGEGR